MGLESGETLKTNLSEEPLLKPEVNLKKYKKEIRVLEWKITSIQALLQSCHYHS